MTFRYIWKTALAGLHSNRTRSALTILGIVIGVMAIIMVVSMGQGAKNLILSEIEGIGASTIAVIPGRAPHGPADALASFSDTLKEKDVVLLSRKENVPHALDIMPVVMGMEAVTYQSEIFRPTIFGGTEIMADLYDIFPAQGRNLTQDEIKSAADVVILGAKVAEELAPGGTILGERVKIKGRNFRVIGILPKKGSGTLVNFDEMALVPYTTGQRYIFGIKYYNRIIVRADSEENVARTVLDITATLRQSHDITDPEKDDFNVQTQEDAMKIVGTILSTLTLFLAMVAAISLVVGGVGIMNIMLVSVTERTREIGLRKALGATNKDILMQFLYEAVLLTGIGGVVGIILGTILSFAASLIIINYAGLNWSFSFPWPAAIIGIVVSSAVGLIFGLYPARKAAAKSPIEALRYE